MNKVRSRRIRPLSWSTSYLLRSPLGISTSTSNSSTCILRYSDAGGSGSHSLAHNCGKRAVGRGRSWPGVTHRHGRSRVGRFFRRFPLLLSVVVVLVVVATASTIWGDAYDKYVDPRIDRWFADEPAEAAARPDHAWPRRPLSSCRPWCAAAARGARRQRPAQLGRGERRAGAVPGRPRPRPSRRRSRRPARGRPAGLRQWRGARDPGVHDQAGDLDGGAAGPRPGPHVRDDSVVAGGPHRVVLVGGGDPFLAAEPPDDETAYPHRADVVTLAKQTAAALKAPGHAPGLGGLRRQPVHGSERQPHVGEGLRAGRRGVADHLPVGRRGQVADRLRAGLGPGPDRCHRVRRTRCRGPASRWSACPSTASRPAAARSSPSVESAPLARSSSGSSRSATTRPPRCCCATWARPRSARRRPTPASAGWRRCWARQASGSAPVSCTTAAGSRAPTGSPRPP